MDNALSSPVLKNCIFSGNNSGADGGGMSNFISATTLTNCTFSGNSARNRGGIYNLIDDLPPRTDQLHYLDNWANNNSGTAAASIYNDYSSLFQIHPSPKSATA